MFVAARRHLSSVAMLAGLALVAGALAIGGARPAAAQPARVVAPPVWPTPQQETARPDGFPLPTTVGLVTGAATDASAVHVVKQAPW